MGTIGSVARNGYAESGLNFANEVACELTMPANGWLTTAHVVMGGYTTNPWTALAVWAVNSGLDIWGSAGFSAGVGLSQHDIGMPNVRIPGGAPFWLGFWRDPNADAVWGIQTGGGNWSADTELVGGPVVFHPSIGSWLAGSLSASVDYVANAAPNAGAWQSPTPSGTISDTNPAFSGTTPQNPGDSAYDSVSQVAWQFTRTDTGQQTAYVVWSINAAVGSWTKRPSDFGISLTAGVQYSTSFAYADSWGAWSPWSASQTFTVNAGPNAPVATSPLGLQYADAGLNFTATYSHGSGLGSGNVQVQVLDATGSSVLYDSGIVAKSVANNSPYTVAQWFGALPWASTFFWWTRAQDTSNVWGPWSVKTPFATDSAPTAPVPRSPASGSIIPGGAAVSLSAAFSDPDGDALTSIVWDLYDTTLGAEVAGYPATVAGSFASGSVQSRAVTTSLISGHGYQWRTQASDGTLMGPWSPWQAFTYTIPPSVTVTAPAAGQVETDASATVTITYGGSGAKASDRTVVTDTATNAVVYDSGTIPGMRTSWALPYSTLSNGHSYSITVTVTDINALSATSAPVAFSASWTTTTSPRLQLLIGGVDRTQYMEQDTWAVGQDWGRQGDTGTIYLTDEHPDGRPSFSIPPVVSVELRDLNLGVLMFGGIVPKPKLVRAGPNLSQWTLACVSKAAYLQSRKATFDYTNQTADYIVRDLLASANCGITANHVSTGPVISRFQGRNTDLKTALTRLCHLASTTSTYGWWVDGGGDMHFAADTQAESIPSGVSFSDVLNGQSTAKAGYYQTGSQTYYEWDATTLKTRVLVQGATITRQFTEQFAGDGTTRSFRLSFPYQTNPEYSVVTVNGVLAPVSSQSGATTPWVLVQGAPGVWSLSVQPNGAPPASGAVIKITYNYAVPVVAQVQSSAGISAAGGPNGGFWDAVIVDSTLTDLPAAQARGRREVQEYALAQERATFTTTEDWPGWLNVGQSFQFSNALVPDSQNGWAAGISDMFLVVQMRANGVAGGYRVVQITAVRI